MRRVVSQLLLLSFRYGQPPSWTLLPEDPDAGDISRDEIQEVLDGYLPVVSARARAREEYLSSITRNAPTSD